MTPVLKATGISVSFGDVHAVVDVDLAVGPGRLVDRLALSPQCGFASGEIARTMTLEEQEAKLRLVGDTARRIWG